MHVKGINEGAAIGADPRLEGTSTEHRANANVAMHQLASAMVAVSMRDGKTLDLSYLAPVIAFHLALRGFRLHQDEALIKSRPVKGAQYQGAIEWVGINAPDDVQAEIDAAKTPQDRANLSANARAAEIRRLGGVPAEDLPEGWKVHTRITFEDGDDNDCSS